MAFSEQTKSEVRKRAHFRCCLCRSIGVEIHHIIPQEHGGTDDESNAAPLCPSCHETYGANPEKRKFLREARDFWYELCEKRISADSEQLRTISTKLEKLATKDDFERFAVQNHSYVLGASNPAPWDHLRFSFVREEFVHPLIVMELQGWISDGHETLIEVDLVSANCSNRFFGEFTTRLEDGRVWVEWKGGKGEFFTYSHVATSPSGVQMLESYECGGGSGIFGRVIFLSLECDRSLTEQENDSILTRERVLLKTYGSIGLGDRYGGKICYKDGQLVIGQDEGWHCTQVRKCRKIPVR